MTRASMIALLTSAIALGCASDGPEALPDDCESAEVCDPFDKYRTVEQCLDFYGPGSELDDCLGTVNDRRAADLGVEEALASYRQAASLESLLDEVPYPELLKASRVYDLMAVQRFEVELAVDRMLTTPDQLDYEGDPRIEQYPLDCFGSYLQVLPNASSDDERDAMVYDLGVCISEDNDGLVAQAAAQLLAASGAGTFAMWKEIVELVRAEQTGTARDLCLEVHPDDLAQRNACGVVGVAVMHHHLVGLVWVVGG